jgi:glycosyltransferase involved in cell wall biosynthesis
MLVMALPSFGPGRLPVTVVVPMYNAEATILRCLDSIVAQSQPPAGVIVVDDASTDGSVELVERRALANLELVRLTANAGPGAARNHGARRVATDWIAFLDADNTWEPTFLEEVTVAISSHSVDFASSGGVRTKVHPRPSRLVRLLPGTRAASDSTADFWRISLRFTPAVPSSTIVRASLFERLGGFPEDVRTGEDATLFARLWLHGRYAFVNRALYTSTQLDTSLTAGGRSYHDIRLLLVRVGQVLWHAIRARRPGTGWFIVAYARMALGRHLAWLGRGRVARR